MTKIELNALGINPRRAIEQMVDYKNDPGNGYGLVSGTGGFGDASQ